MPLALTDAQLKQVMEAASLIAPALRDDFYGTSPPSWGTRTGFPTRAWRTRSARRSASAASPWAGDSFWLAAFEPLEGG